MEKLNTQLKKLSKEKLVQLAVNLLTTHQRYYTEVEKDEINVSAGFFMLAGAIKSIREFNNLPGLMEKGVESE